MMEVVSRVRRRPVPRQAPRPHPPPPQARITTLLSCMYRMHLGNVLGFLRDNGYLVFGSPNWWITGLSGRADSATD